MEITHTHHVALQTSHFAQLRDFYSQTLGLQIVGAFEGYEIIFLQAGSTTIELIAIETTDTPKISGWHHFAFEVEDLDAAYHELLEQGVQFHELPQLFPPHKPVVRLAFFKDPDGNEIELVQPLGKRYP